MLQALYKKVQKVILSIAVVFFSLGFASALKKRAKATLSCELLQNFSKFLQNCCRKLKYKKEPRMLTENFVDFEKMLKNAHIVAKIVVDTAEKEPHEVSHEFPPPTHLGSCGTAIQSSGPLQRRKRFRCAARQASSARAGTRRR